MRDQHLLTLESYTINDIASIIDRECEIKLSEEAIEAVQKCHNFLQSKISSGNQAFYGINTGFGSLCNHVIGKDQLRDLQKNLVLSHACGTGDSVPANVVKIILLLKIRSLA
ncbi:MAG TPA: aromatic amino acid lyase, partial [Saprospiraceae bacterium]|nr:aromatic amino acid lyase [Saprospiraceae bacterium]